MSDYALEWDPEIPAADLLLNDSLSDFESDDGLRTAVILSLYCDARVEVAELPDGETDRRGWWADTEETKIGSRLWLLDRGKNIPNVLALAEQYAGESLKWMIDDKVASTINVTAEIIEAGDVIGLGLSIQIFRPYVDPVTFRFGRTWAAEETRQ